MIRMLDVAKHAGVSVATVSNVITGKNHVSDELKSMVETSIEELGYKINLVARGLKVSSTFTIGVVLPDISRLFFPDILKGIQDAASESNYAINFMSSGYTFSKEKKIIENLKNNRVDGIIINTCCNYDDISGWTKELISFGQSKEIYPVVSLAQEMDQSLMSSVASDNKQATLNSVEYLMKQGRTKILYLTAPLDLVIGRLRFEGYKEGLLSNGIPLNGDLIYNGDFSAKKAYLAVIDAIKRSKEFDAILSANDQMAIGALKALIENNIDIPDKVALVGFDNLFPSTLVTPGISTVNVPRYDMGYQAFEVLEELINDPKRKPIKRILATEFIERQTTNSAVKSDWDLTGW